MRHLVFVAMQVWSTSVSKVPAIHGYHGNVYRDHGIPTKAEKILTAHCCIYTRFVAMGKHLERWAAKIKLKVFCFPVTCSKRTVCYLLSFDLLTWKKASSSRLLLLCRYYWQVTLSLCGSQSVTLLLSVGDHLPVSQLSQKSNGKWALL